MDTPEDNELEPKLPLDDAMCEAIREFDPHEIDTIEDLPTLLKIIKDMERTTVRCVRIRQRADREMKRLLRLMVCEQKFPGQERDKKNR